MKKKFKTAVKPEPIETCVQRFNRGMYTTPMIQRYYSYDEVQECNVITSIIAGLSLDSISLVPVTRDGGKFYLCDGKHRLTALSRFLNDDFVYNNKSKRTKNTFDAFLEDVTGELNGKRFSQLPEYWKNRILNYTLNVIVISPDEELSDEAWDKHAKAAQSAVMRAKNSCSDPMKPDALNLVDTLIDIGNGDDALATVWVSFRKNIEKVMSETKTTLTTVGKTVNQGRISEAFEAVLGCIIANNHIDRQNITSELCTFIAGEMKVICDCACDLMKTSKMKDKKLKSYTIYDRKLGQNILQSLIRQCLCVAYFDHIGIIDRTNETEYDKCLKAFEDARQTKNAQGKYSASSIPLRRVLPKMQEILTGTIHNSRSRSRKASKTGKCKSSQSV